MAKNTNIQLRNKTIYQVHVRQYSKSSNFKGLTDDLGRIKDMGVDILYLLPIHPIGELERKGSIGSPYAIKDYYAIDPLNGTLEEFIELINKAHDLNMKVMIDIVFNHTSRDSILTKEKPEWFYKKPDGSFANRVGDWSDITDFNMDNKEIWAYLIDVLKYWAKYVDGFRCDVAPLLPKDFWLEARHAVDLINPEMIWLTESVEYGFIKYLRDQGYEASSDAEMFESFDIAYDYDIQPFLDAYLRGELPLERYLYEVYRQEVIYPKNYIKLRAYENHDIDRIAQKVNDDEKLLQMTALQFFLKGTTMLYAGQEHQIKHKPYLFEIDLIPWNKEKSIEPLIKTLSNIKKDPIFATGVLDFIETKQSAVLRYNNDLKTLYGIFNLEKVDSINIELKDGIYKNLLNNEDIIVKDNKLVPGKYPIIIEIKKSL